MIISLIVAMDRRRGIGIGNRLPWRLPTDMKRFRQLTMGHHLVVGRRTMASIGKSLPGRTMIVLTRDPGYRVDDCLVARSFEEAANLARSRGEDELFVGGGGEVYAIALPLADRVYLTIVEAEVEADTFFPELNEAEWIETSSESTAVDAQNSLPSTFKVLDRKRL